jgi:chromosome segregation ATPase
MAINTDQLLELLQRAGEELKSVRLENQHAHNEISRLKHELSQLAVLENSSESIVSGDTYLSEKTRVQENDSALLAQRLAALEQEHAQLYQAHQELKEVNEQRKSVPENTGPIEIPAAANTAELEALKSRRDELNAQLGHVEKERNHLKAKLAEIEKIHREEIEKQVASHRASEQETDDLRQRLKETEVEITHFQNHTAEIQERLATAQQKIEQQENRLHALVSENAREMAKIVAAHETVVLQINEAKLNETEQLTKHLHAVEQRGVDEKAQLISVHEKQLAQLTQRFHLEFNQMQSHLQTELTDTTTRLEHARAEFFHANKEYEALHKEMIVLMEQRDEARKLLAQNR